MPPPYPPTIPADIKRKFNDFDNLYDKLKSRVESLESEARRLTAKEEELSKKDRELQQREEALTLRAKATFVLSPFCSFWTRPAAGRGTPGCCPGRAPRG